MNMRNNLSIYISDNFIRILILLALLMYSSSLMSQETYPQLMVLEKDTIIALKPIQLKKVNLKFEELKFQTEQNELYRLSINQYQNNELIFKNKILYQDSIINKCRDIDAVRLAQIENLNVSLKQQKKKNIFTRIESYLVGIGIGIGMFYLFK